ncbi:type II toxin-antitoxin system VapC family toxin [Brucella sp. IR073]|uniref:type II toxin-antitoxin system VapC family toxin n=1 Tax=unclassified Brucella TaxID=2632610 RepID=UPI003B97FFD0
METLVIDASVVVKWVVEEDDSVAALALQRGKRFIAPDLLMAECANILWKKAQRREISTQEAIGSADILRRAEIELVPTRNLLEPATRLAIELGHPAYDCMYLAVALQRKLRFVSADKRLLRAIELKGTEALSALCVPLHEAI